MEQLRQGNTGPDVLDAQIKQFKLKGLSAMRVFLRTRGIPDNMKQHRFPENGSDRLGEDFTTRVGKAQNISESHTTWHGLLNDVKWC